MSDLDPEDVREQALQVEERHPAAEAVRAYMLTHAAELRIAACHVEFLLKVDPDNDLNINAWCHSFDRAMSSLAYSMRQYRTVRDVQGVA